MQIDCSQALVLPNITPENVGLITVGLDLTTGDDENLDEKLEVKLRQYKTSKYKVNFVDKDVFGNPIHDEESEVLLRKKSASRRS